MCCVLSLSQPFMALIPSVRQHFEQVGTKLGQVVENDMDMRQCYRLRFQSHVEAGRIIPTEDLGHVAYSAKLMLEQTRKLYWCY